MRCGGTLFVRAFFRAWHNKHKQCVGQRRKIDWKTYYLQNGIASNLTSALFKFSSRHLYRITRSGTITKNIPMPIFAILSSMQPMKFDTVGHFMFASIIPFNLTESNFGFSLNFFFLEKRHFFNLRFDIISFVSFYNVCNEFFLNKNDFLTLCTCFTAAKRNPISTFIFSGRKTKLAFLKETTQPIWRKFWIRNSPVVSVGMYLCDKAIRNVGYVRLFSIELNKVFVLLSLNWRIENLRQQQPHNQCAYKKYNTIKQANLDWMDV